MGYVFVIFGSLVALNIGVGKHLSDDQYFNYPKEGSVEIETVDETSASNNSLTPAE